MKWFKKWVFKMTKEGSMLMQEADQQAKYAMQGSQPEPIIGSRHMLSNGINFTLYKANGGYVLEYRAPSNNISNGLMKGRDEIPTTKLHIITSDQDMGQQIAHIITFEALQQ